MLHLKEVKGWTRQLKNHSEDWQQQKRSDDPDLCLPDIFHSEVEPDSEAWVAGVRSNEEVKLKITNVVYTPQISYNNK